MIKVLKNEEKAVYTLRGLYQSYGYLSYKMNKFEEYDLYATNKDFLVSDRVITFTDTDGRLLALKPDVTLSILKNAVEGEKQKVCYSENVYRISGKTQEFKEIMQSGLECIGEVSVYDKFEVILLAVKSLESIGGEYLLNLSHLGIFSSVLEGCDEAFKQHVLKHVAQKNKQGVKNACSLFGYENLSETLGELATAYGSLDSIIAKIENLNLSGEYLEELKSLNTLIRACGYENKIRFDLSLVGDMNYYNGLVFKGYLSGISESVLSGGEYGLLAKKMGKNCSAIGFAVYLDLLEGYNRSTESVDVDCLVLYDAKTDLQSLARQVALLVEAGATVRVQTTEEKIRFNKKIDLRGGEQ